MMMREAGCLSAASAIAPRWRILFMRTLSGQKIEKAYPSLSHSEMRLVLAYRTGIKLQ